MTPQQLLSETRVRAIYGDLMQAQPGRVGEREPGCIGGIIGNAFSAASYDTEDEPDVLHVAASLLFYFATNQCLIDGNKRVAWASCVEQLAVFGIDVSASEAEAAAFTLDVAEKRLTRARAIEWLASHVSAMPA